MSLTFSRTDSSVFGRWWWTVDHLTLAALGVLIGFGAFLVAASSPPVAERIGLGTFHFVQRHFIMLAPAVLVMIGVSLLSPRWVRRVALLVLAGSILLTAATFIVGAEIKGARRWIHLAGVSIQPSEFLKPAFAVVAAWLFAKQHAPRYPGSGYLPGNIVSTVLFLVIAVLLMKQPDLGMTLVISAVWFCQFFLAGLPLLLVAVLALAGAGGIVGAYFLFPHVTSRIDRFLDPQSGDNYQVERSLQAFANGGLSGTGPGQGTVKFNLPDAHADFIFAVAGEELGLFWSLLLVSLFAFVVLRGFSRLMHDPDLFIVLAAGGLLVQFGLQALIHMGSSVHLLPTKGMTLPFVSYGGSSLIALGFGMGMVLALTRRRFSTGEGR